MHPPRNYDIFSGRFDENVIWLEAVEGLGNAVTKMKWFAAQDPGPYFVFSIEEHSVIASVDTTEPDKSEREKSA